VYAPQDFVNDGAVPVENFVVDKSVTIRVPDEVQPGGVALQVIYLSVDPYMRNLMK
jgi:NADPH-dependent curcumin reductase CurA